MTWVALFVLSV